MKFIINNIANIVSLREILSVITTNIDIFSFLLTKQKYEQNESKNKRTESLLKMGYA